MCVVCADDERGDAMSAGASSPFFAGVELGGTKCVCTLAYGPDVIVDQRTVPTTAPSETLPAICAILSDWERDHGPLPGRSAP